MKLPQKLVAAEAQVDELEEARLANLPVDAAKEVAALKARMVGDNFTSN